MRTEKEAFSAVFNRFGDYNRPPFDTAVRFGVLDISAMDVTEPVLWGPMPPECQRLFAGPANLVTGFQAMGRQYRSYRLTVSDAAKAAGIPAEGGRVIIGSKELVAVTGVQEGKDSATAEFVWIWNGNYLEKKFSAAFDREFTDFVPTLARFSKYDDSWRFVSAACSTPIPAADPEVPVQGCEELTDHPLPSARNYVPK